MNPDFKLEHHTLEEVAQALEAAAVSAENWNSKAETKCRHYFRCKKTGFD